MSSIPKHHDAEWFNPVHHGLLGNRLLHSQALAKTRAPFLGGTGFLVFDAMFINPFGPSVSKCSIPEPAVPLSPTAADD